MKFFSLDFTLFFRLLLTFKPLFIYKKNLPRAFTCRDEMPLIKVAYLMLNFLNLKSKPIHLFFGVASSLSMVWIGYHSNFYLECNTERGFKNQLYIELGYLPVLLASSGSQWSKSRNKEMKTREGDHVDGQLPQISIKLTRETQTSGHTCKSNIWITFLENIKKNTSSNVGLEPTTLGLRVSCSFKHCKNAFSLLDKAPQN